MSLELLIKWCAFIVLLLVLWGMSNYLVKRKTIHNQYLRQLAFLPLTPGHSLHLIQAGRHRHILLATSPQKTDLVLNLEGSQMEQIMDENPPPGLKHESSMIEKLVEDLIRRSGGGRSP